MDDFISWDLLKSNEPEKQQPQRKNHRDYEIDFDF